MYVVYERKYIEGFACKIVYMQGKKTLNCWVLFFYQRMEKLNRETITIAHNSCSRSAKLKVKNVNGNQELVGSKK